MSGGRFDYYQRNLGNELFDYKLYVDYGDDGHEQSKIARKLNPMHDRELSELVWDVLCLVHSLDWCESGDTGEDTYKADVKWFKNKWFKRTDSDRKDALKEDLQDFYNQLLDEIEWSNV